MSRLMKYAGVFIFMVLDVRATPSVDGTIFIEPDIMTSDVPFLIKFAMIVADINIKLMAKFNNLG